METYSIDVEKILIQQLEKKGLDQNIIPRFIKDIINSYCDDTSMSLFQINDRLQLLGWDDIVLDYNTFQLTETYLENDGMNDTAFYHSIFKGKGHALTCL